MIKIFQVCYLKRLISGVLKSLVTILMQQIAASIMFVYLEVRYWSHALEVLSTARIYRLVIGQGRKGDPKNIWINSLQ